MSTFWYYFATGLIGFLVGLSELLNRYKSFYKIFAIYCSWLYMLVNVIASLFVYYIVVRYKIALGTIGEYPIGKILVAGLGAMAFLRSSFFTYKDSSGKIIEIGPAALLNIFLTVAEREFDQSLSKDYLDNLNKLMIGLNFLSASKDLPLILLSLMRVLSDVEQKQLSDEILKLVNDPTSTTDAKNISLGGLLIKYTGFDLLKSAVDKLKEIYRSTTKPIIDKLDQAQQKLNNI